MGAVIRRDNVPFSLAGKLAPGVDPPTASATRDSIGPLLARARLEQGKSQLHLAEQLCAAAALPTITRHEISRWEQEKRIPSRMWLPWLAIVLDLPPEQLERAAAHARKQRTAYRGG